MHYEIAALHSSGYEIPVREISFDKFKGLVRLSYVCFLSAQDSAYTVACSGQFFYRVGGQESVCPCDEHFSFAFHFVCFLCLHEISGHVFALCNGFPDFR